MSKRLASERTASERASERLASERTASKQASERLASERTASKRESTRLASERTASSEQASEQASERSKATTQHSPHFSKRQASTAYHTTPSKQGSAASVYLGSNAESAHTSRHIHTEQGPKQPEQASQRTPAHRRAPSTASVPSRPAASVSSRAQVPRVTPQRNQVMHAESLNQPASALRKDKPPSSKASRRVHFEDEPAEALVRDQHTLKNNENTASSASSGPSRMQRRKERTVPNQHPEHFPETFEGSGQTSVDRPRTE